MPFETISSSRLYQQAADQVRTMIRSEEVKPGERLPPERELARQLGVSRPTVREAMIALEIAGLVEIRVGSGIYVTPLAQRGSRALVNHTDAGPSPFELLSARQVIEGEIAARAAATASASELARIAETLKAMEDDLARGETGQVPDRLFHARIAEATHNSVLTGLVNELWDGMFAPIFHTLSVVTGLSENLQMTIKDHYVIYEALRSRDSDRARSAMCAHLANVERILGGTDDLSECGNTGV